MTRLWNLTGVAAATACLLTGSAFAGNQGTKFTFTNEGSSEQTQTDTYSWEVQKSLKPNQVPYIIRQGETLPVEFLLTATRSEPATSYANSPVNGQVCVTNSGTQSTVGLWIVVRLEQSLDGGATWTPFAGPQVVPAVDVAGGATQCFPYTFFVDLLPPPALYRNNDTVTIDNFVGFEGTAYSIDGTAPVVVTPQLVEVDKTATLQDEFLCPDGFDCTPPWTSITLTESYPTTPFVVSLSNVSAECGMSVVGLNTATLTPHDSPALPPVSAAASIYTGTCRGPVN
jgi:hypothetical protein